MFEPKSHRLHLAPDIEARAYVFDSGGTPICAIAMGDPRAFLNPLVRVHSRCMYSEVFGSMDCDCAAQIRLALTKIRSEGSGLFIYLEQEGRGCGLVAKAMAYELQEARGLDTVAAYKALGLPVDARDYAPAARVLEYFGLTRVRLLTNNPDKVRALAAAGVGVRPAPLRTRPTKLDIDYLRVKQQKLGHTLGLRSNSTSPSRP